MQACQESARSVIRARWPDRRLGREALVVLPGSAMVTATDWVRVPMCQAADNGFMLKLADVSLRLLHRAATPHPHLPEGGQAICR